MEKCWDSDPSKRPTIVILENIISQWLGYINRYYELNNEGNETLLEDIGYMNNQQIKNNIYEFVKADKALTQEQANTSIHPQACYTSRLLTEILDQKYSECFDCIIEN
ncbi:hypothetical protein C1645_795000 [Glomus cerebriforme]|uniref:Serine-threonine/tyrosine-protein kinase catalytic domain-containing protein n=1 Tax=Glomus cerebriforme TaxID=658196 RepID=A0A397S0E2_9GLOM|nr:hypothetical protein C1645_795000 [Glomus cerebriforme]